jgi:hypothetical protein
MLHHMSVGVRYRSQKIRRRNYHDVEQRRKFSEMKIQNPDGMVEFFHLVKVADATYYERGAAHFLSTSPSSAEERLADDCTKETLWNHVSRRSDWLNNGKKFSPWHLRRSAKERGNVHRRKR